MKEIKKVIVVCLCFLGSISFGQYDSTDLNLFTSSPTLESEMDSMMFGNGSYLDYEMTYAISDTADFGTIAIELFTINNNVLYRHTYALSELQSLGLIDENWQINLNFGKFEINETYLINIVVGNYAGILSPSISKSY